MSQYRGCEPKNVHMQVNTSTHVESKTGDLRRVFVFKNGREKRGRGEEEM